MPYSGHGGAEAGGMLPASHGGGENRANERVEMATAHTADTFDPWAPIPASGSGSGSGSAPVPQRAGMYSANAAPPFGLKRARPQYTTGGVGAEQQPYNIPDHVRANLAAAEEKYKRQKQGQTSAGACAGVVMGGWIDPGAVQVPAPAPTAPTHPHSRQAVHHASFFDLADDDWD